MQKASRRGRGGVALRPTPSLMQLAAQRKPKRPKRHRLEAVAFEIVNAMCSPDGAWRVELVHRGRGRSYRVLHGETVIDWLNIRRVRRVLAEAGVDMATLVEVDPAA